MYPQSYQLYLEGHNDSLNLFLASPNVQYHVLWENKDTGAKFVLLKIPKGGVWELPHSHPQANQAAFVLSGESVGEDGTRFSWGEGDYGFSYRPKEIVHGPRKGSGMKVTEDCIILQYFDGPPTKLNEGETEELTL